MIKPIYIYTLNCPKTGDIRYVGKTKFPIEKRLRFHLRDLRGNSHKVKWIKSLILNELKPSIHCIEVVSELNWIEKEIFWIAKMKSNGCDLVNNSIGGEGACGVVYSEESLKNFKEGRLQSIKFYRENGLSLNPHKNKTPEERHIIALKIGQTLRGRKISEETKRKISDSGKGRKITEKQREAYVIAAKKRGVSDVTKKAFVEKHSKSITQLTRDGLFVNKYKSLREASDTTNINKGHIGSCARQERKTAGDYIWIYN